ncbi:unnamed protein product [Musa hybrid cultivar]
MFHQDQHHQVQLPNVHHQQHRGQQWVRYLHLSPTYCSSQPNDPLLMTGSGTSSNDELVSEAEHESSLRWTRKTVASDEPAAGRPGRVSRTPHHDSCSSSSPGGVIRFCSDCTTTKTPLWRSGPQGPKSLCNACGIRRRKARRAMAPEAAAAVGSDGRRIPADRPTKALKQKKKKKKKKKKIRFDDDKSSAFHQVFPQDEKDAAVLLMALSCGLIHG